MHAPGRQDPRAASDPVDLDEARRFDSLQNRLFPDPILRGAYPEDTLADLQPFSLRDVVRSGGLEVIGAPLDFLGVNHCRDDLISGHPDPSCGDGHSGGATRPTSSCWIGSEDIVFPSRGLRIPEDIAVVGFDDDSFAPSVTPAPTTVNHPIIELGRKMAETLVDMSEGRPTDRVTIMSTSLELRDSVRPAHSVRPAGPCAGGSSPPARSPAVSSRT